MKRRDLLAGAAAGAFAAVLAKLASPRVASANTGARTGPRYWIQLVPGGGIDAVLTTDPRTAKDVKAGVDVPYKPSDIVDAKGMRLGPHFKGLAPWSEKLAVINGVRVQTANHHTGFEQISRLRTHTTGHSNSVFEILGAHRDGQAVGAVCVAAGNQTSFTPNFIGQPVPLAYGTKLELFSAIDEMTREDLQLAAKTMERHAASFRRAGVGSTPDRRRLTALEDSARLFKRLVDTPKLKKTPWFTGPDAMAESRIGFSDNLQRSLWLIENDLASSVSVACSLQIWDTHWDTDRRQSRFTPLLVANLVRLFQELESRSNKYGKLSDQTAVVVASEIGRFPYKNASNGKDHYPQMPVLLFGKWFNTGAAYGDTDKELNSHPISLKTGRGDRHGHLVTLDDVGVTALRLAGLDPEVYGINGKNLDFVVRS